MSSFSIPLAETDDALVPSIGNLKAPGGAHTRGSLDPLTAGAIEHFVSRKTDTTLAGVKERFLEFEKVSRSIFDANRSAEAPITVDNLQLLERFVGLTGQIVADLNSLGSDFAHRGAATGEFLLQLVARSWMRDKERPQGNAGLLYDLIRSRYLEGNALTIPQEEWQRSFSLYFDGYDVTHQYPDHLAYIAASPQLSSKIPSLDKLVDEVESINKELERSPDGSIKEGASGGKKGGLTMGAWASVDIPIAKREKLFKRLLEEAKDVDPFKVQAVTEIVNGKILPREPIIEFLLNLKSHLDKGLAAYAAKGELPLGQSFVSLGVRDKKMVTVERQLATEGENVLARMISLLNITRHTLLMVARDIGVAHNGKIEAPLHAASGVPFSDRSEDYAMSLLARVPAASSNLVAQALRQPVLLAERTGTWVYPVSEPSCGDFLTWTIRHYLFNPSAEKECARLLADSFPQDFGVYPFIRGIRDLVVSKDFGRLARDLERRINDQDEMLKIVSRDGKGASLEARAYQGLALLAVFATLSGHEATRERLRDQVPSIDKLRSITTSLEPLLGAHEYLSAFPRKILSRFGPSLDTCNLNPQDRKALERLISNFDILEQNKSLREGIQGNKLFRSGVLLSGPPGTGKTYLTQVLASRLGAERFQIRPLEAQRTVDMFDPHRTDSLNERITGVVNSLIEEAKKGTLCVFEIDEAEHFIPLRTQTHLTQERRDMCVYFLEVLNEIRINYPNVLIVIASNHRSLIDIAGIRDGRIDYEIALDFPDAEQRKRAIERDISRHAVNFISPKALDELVALTDGAIFVGIAATINEYFLFETRRRQMKDSAYVSNIDDLVTEFRELQEMRKIKNAGRDGESRAGEQRQQTA